LPVPWRWPDQAAGPDPGPAAGQQGVAVGLADFAGLGPPDLGRGTPRDWPLAVLVICGPAGVGVVLTRGAEPLCAGELLGGPVGPPAVVPVVELDGVGLVVGVPDGLGLVLGELDGDGDGVPLCVGLPLGLGLGEPLAACGEQLAEAPGLLVCEVGAGEPPGCAWVLADVLGFGTTLIAPGPGALFADGEMTCGRPVTAQYPASTTNTPVAIPTTGRNQP
jgi:hypothetical protein